ncbi:MAG TPA: 2-C-methyl-D-erythritol 4-phosphate cytidylyltransferase [Ktedonobacterales bacterium]|nr:2-C-methyl-D-erythritol 4-phosphate cytidylyltransferase [Ktedonobacterales bacterium]
MAPVTAPNDTRRTGAVLLAISGSGALDSGGFDPFWAPFAGLPLLAQSVSIFERAPNIAEIVLVVAPDRLADVAALATQQSWRRIRAIATSSSSRRAVYRLALDTLSRDIAWIVIHDAARPLIQPGMIADGLAALSASSPECAAAAASIPVNETLKRVENGRVVETPTRSQLRLLQTPEVVVRAALVAALEDAPAELDPPDAATLVVAANFRVALFPGSPANFRVASAADLALAETLLGQR